MTDDTESVGGAETLKREESGAGVSGAAPAATQRRLSEVAMASGLLAGVVLVSLAMVLAALASLRGQALSAAEQGTQAQARLVEESVTHSLALADLILQAVIKTELGGGASAAEARARLLQRAASLPQVRSLFVTDSRGEIVLESGEGSVGNDVSDRDYFALHAAGGADVLHVGTVVRGRSTGRWLVPVSRARRAPDGRVEAVAVAALDPSYFAQWWEGMNVGDQGVVNLFRVDGTLMMRSPFDEALLGRTFAVPPGFLERARQTPHFTLRERGMIDGVERIFSIRRVEGHDQLVVSVGTSVDHALATWRRFSMVAIGGWALASSALAVLALFLLRGQRLRRGVEARLASAARLVEETPNPVFRVGAKGEMLFANPAGERMLRELGDSPAQMRREWSDYVTRAGAGESIRSELAIGARAYIVTAVPMASAGYTNLYTADITERRLADRRLRAQLARTELLHDITRAIGERLDLDAVLQAVCDSTQARLPAAFCAALLHQAMPRRLVVRCVAEGSRERAVAMAFEPGSIVAECEELLDHDWRRDPVLHDPRLEGAGAGCRPTLAKGGLRSAAMTAIHVEGGLFALLLVARDEFEAFDADEVAFLARLAEHAGLAVHQAQLHECVHQAYEEVMRANRDALRHDGLRALGQMAGGVAHDINNAIAPVALYTESLLASEAALSEEGRSWLRNIQQAVDGVAATVERMREFHRPTVDALERQEVDPNALVAEVAGLARAQAVTSGEALKIETELAEGLPKIRASAAEIRGALMHLVSNARDALPDGGGTIILRSRVGPSAGRAAQVIVEVRDDGAGMDEVTVRRCLEPFFTTKGQRGTGLGLSMVYGAMQRHGGDVEIESELGKGATVRLLFPTVPDPSSAARSQPSLHAPLRILVIDDDPLVLDSVARMLQFDGHGVESAAGGLAGIGAFRAALEEGRPYDLVITDLGMPEVDGREVAAAVKREQPRTGVIVLTGWGEQMAGTERDGTAADEVIGKPPRLAQLREAITRSRAR